jgi:hypothetical protein
LVVLKFWGKRVGVDGGEGEVEEVPDDHVQTFWSRGHRVQEDDGEGQEARVMIDLHEEKRSTREDALCINKKYIL